MPEQTRTSQKNVHEFTSLSAGDQSKVTDGSTILVTELQKYEQLWNKLSIENKKKLVVGGKVPILAESYGIFCELKTWFGDLQ